MEIKERVRRNLFPLGDKLAIIHQTTNWRLDNAVEPTHFIKNTFPDPIPLQTVRNALTQTTFIMF